MPYNCAKIFAVYGALNLQGNLNYSAESISEIGRIVSNNVKVFYYRIGFSLECGVMVLQQSI